jgi:CheY-like chemotaxis protein
MADTRLALVVDDDETLRLVAKRHLSKLGFIVHYAGTGKEAVDACKGLDFELILMDLQMPEMDGFEATAEIRAMELTRPRAKAIIIAMTASQDRERALKSGMNDFLFKPFMYETVQRTITKWFPESSAAV